MPCTRGLPHSTALRRPAASRVLRSAERYSRPDWSRQTLTPSCAPPPLSVNCRVRCSAVSGGDDFIKAFYDTEKFFRREPADSLAEALNGKCANLADLHPRPIRKTAAQQLDGQGKPGRLRLARDRHGDHGAGALVKD